MLIIAKIMDIIVCLRAHRYIFRPAQTCKKERNNNNSVIRKRQDHAVYNFHQLVLNYIETVVKVSYSLFLAVKPYMQKPI
jgi:hypothetical protein